MDYQTRVTTVLEVCSAHEVQRIAASVRMGPVKTIPVPKTRSQKPKADPHYSAAVQRAKDVAQRLRRAGVIDAEGHRIRTDLPADLRDGQDLRHGPILYL